MHYSINHCLALALSAALLSFASCTKEKPIVLPTPGDTDISFQASVAQMTRAELQDNLLTTWTEGDAIGVFANVSGQPIGTKNYLHNVKLVFTNGTWVCEDDAKWPADNSSLDFYAYYPYIEDIGDPTNFTFTVSASQNADTEGVSNFSSSDLMNATARQCPSGSTVVLPFIHMLSVIELEVESYAKGMGISDEVEVAVSNAATTATVNLLKGTAATSSTEKSPVTMHRVQKPDDEDYETKFTYMAFVPVQEFEQGTQLFNFNLSAIGGTDVASDPAAEKITLSAGRIFSTVNTPMELQRHIHTVAIPAGSFMMGSPETEEDRNTYGLQETQHQVTFTKGFRMTKYEITNAMYAVFLNEAGVGEDGMYETEEFGSKKLVTADGVQYSNGQWTASEISKNYPVVRVTWYGANEFAKWMGGSLPTESQWEYAYRAGSQDAYPFPKEEIDDYGWWLGNATAIQPVGLKEPNAWGIYDMVGNAIEWCDDWFVSDWGSEALTDPKGASSGTMKALRSSSIRANIETHRAASRNCDMPSMGTMYFGFRMVFND